SSARSLSAANASSDADGEITAASGIEKRCQTPISRERVSDTFFSVRDADAAGEVASRDVAPRLRRLECDLERILDALEPHELELLARLLGDVLEVLPIAGRQHHALDAGAQRREHLLLDAADRQHEAAQ